MRRKSKTFSRAISCSFSVARVTPRRPMTEAVKTLPGTRFPGASERRAGQEARQLFPGRYRHDQPACAPMEVRRRRPPRTLGVGFREQGFCRGFRLEVPATADDAGGKATPGRSVGAGSVVAPVECRAGDHGRPFALLRARVGVWVLPEKRGEHAQ